MFTATYPCLSHCTPVSPSCCPAIRPSVSCSRFSVNSTLYKLIIAAHCECEWVLRANPCLSRSLSYSTHTHIHNLTLTSIHISQLSWQHFAVAKKWLCASTVRNLNASTAFIYLFIYIYLQVMPVIKLPLEISPLKDALAALSINRSRKSRVNWSSYCYRLQQ